ncbi:hypothetical protein [Paenibacillus sp. RUD330]|uniref:XkdQ/YqbQ family protein n=1 Tax=Paenibacillus sp. RUD330 TaxID=2023772 RepID=UPI000B928392|nr:hypothetical protein [Paenibacillus sp. RUD330]ASS66548.1 hypothetical protein CIC07_10545 [Paenibacillus sp. RUD330]
MISLKHVSRAGVKTDLSGLFLRLSWSGDKSTAARSVTFSVLFAPNDKNIPKVPMELGEMIFVYDDDGKEIFRGYLFKMSKSLSGSSIEYTAYDGLRYLTQSKVNRIFKAATAASVARTVCAEIGVPVGYLEDAGGNQRFAALNRSAYEAIMIGYTGASKTTGHKYIPRMSAGRLSVIRKGARTAAVMLTADTNLTEASYTESIEDAVTAVKIVDKNDNYVGEVTAADNLKRYGRLQEIYQQEEKKDPYAPARAMLKGAERTANVTVFGNGQVDLITGNAVRIQDQLTGLVGLFYVDSDEHVWENGMQTITLTVNFQNLMDEQEGGEVDSGSSKASSSGAGSTGYSLDNFVYP